MNGLVITARCDLAQSKYPILNYLPVVTLLDWLRRDGLDILLAHEMQRQHGLLNRMLRNANVSISLVDSIPLENIAEMHFPVGEGTKKQKKSARELRDHIILMRKFSTICTTSSNDELYTWFRTERQSEIRTLIKRLSHHTVLGHYFFETLSPDKQQSNGFVCLLREVATLPKPIAERLGRGLSAANCLDLCGETYSLSLSFVHQDLAMPIVEIGSPTIEHVLQMWSTLFGRIGVQDPVEEQIEAIVSLSLSKKRRER